MLGCTSMVPASPLPGTPAPSGSITKPAQLPLMLQHIREFNLQALRLCVEASLETVNARTESNRSPLIVAASEGNAAALSLLLDHGADVRATDDDGNSSLHHAARSGKVASLQQLIKHGALLDASNHLGETALHMAAAGGNFLAVRCLVCAGVDVRVKKNTTGETALHYAMPEAEAAVGRILLDHGAAIEARSAEGVTALMIAADCGNLNAVRMLCQAEAEINAQCNAGRSALTRAAATGLQTMVEWLISQGADIGLQDENGRTTLEYVLARHVRTPVNSPDNRLGNSAAVEDTLAWEEPVDENSCMTLIDAGALAGMSRDQLDDMLGNAATHGLTSVVETLLVAGADPGSRAAGDSTALHKAFLHDRADTVALLIQHHALRGRGTLVDDERGLGENLVMLAVRLRAPATLALLLQRGAPLEDTNAHGASALDLALQDMATLARNDKGNLPDHLDAVPSRLEPATANHGFASGVAAVFTLIAAHLARGRPFTDSERDGLRGLGIPEGISLARSLGFSERARQALEKFDESGESARMWHALVPPAERAPQVSEANDDEPPTKRSRQFA